MGLFRLSSEGKLGNIPNLTQAYWRASVIRKILLGDLSGKVENDVWMAALAIAFIEGMLDFLSDPEQQITVITWAFH